MWGCPGVPVHEGIPIVFITIHGLMTQFVNVSFFCVPVHEDTTNNVLKKYCLIIEDFSSNCSTFRIFIIALRNFLP